jgi:hypothetical protein
VSIEQSKVSAEMGYTKRPETPNVTEDRSGIDIAYNGVRLRFRKSMKGNAIYEGMICIDETLEGRLVEKRFNVLKRDKDNFYKERNIALPEERRDVLDLIRKYAEWFTLEAEDVLDGLLLRYSTESCRAIRDQPSPGVNAGNPNQAYRDAQRKRFNDIWAIVLSYNVSPEEAEAILRNRR